MLWFLSQKAKYYLSSMLDRRADAKALIKGSKEYPQIIGNVNFYQTKDGVLAAVELIGLPHKTGDCSGGVFGFHIHEGTSCTGTNEDPFADTKTHYDPKECKHPYHAGDLPPLFENNGRAFMVILTDRFTADEIIGRTIVVHSSPDDFTSQPAGNSGKKIACGVIRKA